MNEENLNELNSLGCPLWAEYELDDILEWMKEDTIIYINKDEYSFEKKPNMYARTFPRFGIYSIILRELPVFIFDDPILEKKLGETACTDGSNIFFNLSFYKQLSELEQKDKEERLGVIPVILHEISHILDNDVFRYPNIDHYIANIASDIYNNSYIKQSFNNIKWLPYLIDIGFGLKAGDEYYSQKSSEAVLIDILEKIKTGESPKITEEELKRINSDKYIIEERGRSIDFIETDLKKENKKENHVINKKELIDALNEAGLPHVIRALGLDIENIENSIKNNENNIKEIIKNGIEEVDKIKKNAGLNSKNTPSGSLIDNIKEKINFSRNAKLSWTQQIINEVWGEGGKDKYNHDQPNDVFYIDEISEMIGFNLYEGSAEKYKSDDVVLAILDTSSSMDKEDLSKSMTELIGIQREANSDVRAKELIVVFADADIKENNIIVINDGNYEQILNKLDIDIFGRGGTDFKTSINSALKIKELKDKTISSTIIFTDLFDEPPKKDEIIKSELQKRMSITYISVNQDPIYVENFRKKVRDYASVVVMDGRQKNVDLKNNPKNIKRKKYTP